MFVKVYLVNCSNYDSQYYKRRFRLPLGELEEYGEHRVCSHGFGSNMGEGLTPVLGGLRLVGLVYKRVLYENLGSVSRDASWPQMMSVLDLDVTGA